MVKSSQPTNLNTSNFFFPSIMGSRAGLSELLLDDPDTFCSVCA